MLQIAVCDDEALHRERTAALVGEELAKLTPEIDCFESGEALLHSMSLGDYTPDIALLDIQMGGVDGISLAKRLNSAAPKCRIIFITSFLEFAPDVYSAEHVYFIIKAELKKRLGEALRKALAELPAARSVICVRGKRSAQIFPTDSVLYVERVGRRTRIVTESGEYFVAPPPAELLHSAPDGLFVRCHQSIWVNSAKITRLKSEEFLLCDGSSVPISRGCRTQARAGFFASLSGR